jgi:hypothetical protein
MRKSEKSAPFFRRARMKAHLSYKALFALAVSIVLMGLGAGTVNSATTVVTYQVSAGADDGYAWSAAEQDINSSYLLIGDDRTYTAPYYMSAMRFTNVDVPRNAQIVDAHLKISSISEGLRGQIYGLIQAEKADDAADFTARYIGAISKTTAATDWDHKDAWAVNTYYTSPDISSVIQEVVSQNGWNSGNAMTTCYSTRTDAGKSRMFGSFESGAGFAAVLEITYETYSISGYIKTPDNTGVEDVTVSAGADIESTATNTSGYYELKVPPGWSGTVSVSKEGWGFTEWSRSYTNVTSDQIYQNFTTFQPKISGYVRNNGGYGVGGVNVSADNGGASDTTVYDGYYEITVPYNWSGTVEVSRDGWGFSPWSMTYTNVTANQTDQNYTGFQPKISGYVKNEAGLGVYYVLVSANNGGGQDRTDENGFYQVTVPYDWSGQVALSRTGWVFTPANLSFANVTGDLSAQEFSGHHLGITVKLDGGGDFTSIQSAISFVYDGEEITVYPGRYYENNISVRKDIVLRSIDPNDPNIVAATIIDGQNDGRLIIFGREPSSCIISGFTLTNGKSLKGGAILGISTKATVAYCAIVGNSADSYGGGL